MMYNHEISEKVDKPRPVSPMPLRSECAHELARIYIDKRGLSSRLAFANGWFGSENAGDGFARVVVPALNTAGVPYWQARFIGTPRGATPRYQSPYSARLDSLVIIQPVEEWNQLVTVSEGPFDALALAELGYYSVALMGNRPPGAVWDHLHRRFTGLRWANRVVLVADYDSVGETAGWQMQLAVRGIKSRIVVPSQAKDAAALTVEQRRILMEVI